MNHLYYGDNLDILRRYIKDESVDLIYLDPPFNSKRNYNAVFKGKTGEESAAQVKAFEDTWHWSSSAASYHEILENGPESVAACLAGFHSMLGTTDMLAYLSMMAIRLIELHRVLKPTGSIYLHCDPTMSHYLKVLLDAIFGPEHFRTEIIWKRTTAHNDTKQGRKQHGRIHDTILYYTKSDNWTWNPQYTPYDPDYVESAYKHVEQGTGRRYQLDNLTGPGGSSKGNPSYEVMGVTRYWRYSREKMEALIREGRIIQTKPGAVPRYKRYLDEMPGIALQDLWVDVGMLSSYSGESLGYPTQKPEALLERIIASSSHEGDVVLDPFCGCGTAVTVAQRLSRRWIGIDITHLAVNLIRTRLMDSFGDRIRVSFEVKGEPTTLEDAIALAEQDKYQFQFWALGLVGARPNASNEKKGADRGIDGKRFFADESTGKPKTVVISVKGGNKVPANAVRDLRGTIERENAEIGVLISLAEPTRNMKDDAASAGYYESPMGGRYPRIQLLTTQQLLEGAVIQMPSVHQTRSDVETIKRAKRSAESDKQGTLGI